MKLALVKLGSVGAETLASLERAQRVVVGTSTDCDVVVDREEYPTVSRKHVLVAARKEGSDLLVYISDTDSTNGTYINGKRLQGKEELKVGDTVSLSRNAFEFTLAVQESSDSSEAKDDEGEVAKEKTTKSQSRLSELREKRLASRAAKDTAANTGNNQEEGTSPVNRSNSQAGEEERIGDANKRTIEEDVQKVKDSVKGRVSTGTKAEVKDDKMSEEKKDRSASREGRVALISDETHKRILLKEDLTDVKSLAIDAKSGRVAYALTGGELYIQGFDNNELVNKATTSGQDVTAIRFSKDGKFIAIAKRNKEISIWDMDFKKEMQVLSGHRLAIADLSFSSDSKRLASCSLDKTIRFWDIDSAQETACSQVKGLGITAIDFNQDGSKLVTGGKDRTIGMWNSNTGELETNSEKVSSGIESICCIDGAKQVLLATSDRLLHQKDIEELDNTIVSLKYANSRARVSICNSGKFLGCLEPNGKLQIWEINF